MPSTRRGNCFTQLFSLSSCFALQFSSCPQFSTVSSRRALSPRRHPPPPPPVQGSSPFWTQFSKDAVDFQRGRCGLQSSIRDLSAWSSTRWPSFSTRGHPLGSRHALIFHFCDSTVARGPRPGQNPGDNAANDAGLLFVKLKNGRSVMFEERGQYGTPGIRCIFFLFFPPSPSFFFCSDSAFILFPPPPPSFFVRQLYSFGRLLSGKLGFYLNCSWKQILTSLIFFKRKFNYNLKKQIFFKYVSAYENKFIFGISL